MPWLAVIPGAAVAVWLSSPRHANWSRVPRDAGRVRRSFAHAVAALTVLRNLVVPSEREWTAFAGAALYRLGDMVTLWAALRVFDVRLSIPVLVLAYGTGWALTRRSALVPAAIVIPFAKGLQRKLVRAAATT